MHGGNLKLKTWLFPKQRPEIPLTKLVWLAVPVLVWRFLWLRM